MMQSDAILRQHIVRLLSGNDAHAEFEKAISDLPQTLRGQRPEGAEHSPWEVLEHLRITQWDILEFSRNPKHTSPDFPSGYWPGAQAPPSAAAWEQSVESFLKDRDALCDLVTAESTDLYAKIPHGDGQTILREALLAADHTAYHLGELVLLRRLVKGWK
jgi:hypothetical protein